ncbi:uncharacterized protein LOC125659622 [Ostrea edulis]|uniref:uncharacterized protein LOC125659622 n=1 Tax=Ostrea edulis TaxID=37623 RepID=UPI0024AEEA1D|nr:uncharacterized protein LOC125659622 [Ostrea edulis]
MKTVSSFLFLCLFNLAALNEIQDHSHQIKLHSDIRHCKISPSVFLNVFTVLDCSEFGYQQITRHCGRFLTVQDTHESRQRFTISRKGAIFRVLFRDKDAYLANAKCCVMEFELFQEYFILYSESEGVSYDCDVVIVLDKNVVLHKNVKRSAKRKEEGIKISQERVHEGDHSDVTGAVIYNSTIRSSRAANGTFRNMSRFNESKWEMIERKLTIKLSHDPEWAMLSMTCIILLLLLAVKCCKLTDSRQSKLQYVDYIEDWHTTTVNEVVRRKSAFLDILRRFKNKKRRKQLKRDDRQRLLSKKKSHSDGEDQISDESDELINL